MNAEQDTQRELALYPTKGGGQSSGMLFEDDGESHRWQQGGALWLSWQVTTDNHRIDITFERTGSYQPAWHELAINLPQHEHRELYINGVASDKLQINQIS